MPLFCWALGAWMGQTDEWWSSHLLNGVSWLGSPEGPDPWAEDPQLGLAGQVETIAQLWLVDDGSPTLRRILQQQYFALVTMQLVCRWSSLTNCFTQRLFKSTTVLKKNNFTTNEEEKMEVERLAIGPLFFLRISVQVLVLVHKMCKPNFLLPSYSSYLWSGSLPLTNTAWGMWMKSTCNKIWQGYFTGRQTWNKFRAFFSYHFFVGVGKKTRATLLRLVYFF